MNKNITNYQPLFNHPDTLVVISSFPAQKGEVAKENAVARYTDLLVKNFPKKQQVVVLCELREGESDAYLAAKNVLVVPTFTRNSVKMFTQLQKELNNFSHAQSILIQFELSIFGGPTLTFGFVPFCTWQKLQGKRISVALHQVITNFNDMAEHIGVAPFSVKAEVMNTGLQTFYRGLGRAVETCIVHDQDLATKLSQFVDAKKIVVIPHGIGPTQTFTTAEKYAARQTYGLAKTDFVVTAYGYQSIYKGTDWIVDAVTALAKKYPKLPIKLLLAGDLSPTQKSNLPYQKFAKKLHQAIQKSSAIVVTTGFVPEPQVAQVFAASDVLVYPYRARMSASGALSLAWQYQKPFLISEAAAENLTEPDVKKSFDAVKLSSETAIFFFNQPSFNQHVLQVFSQAKLRAKLAKVGQDVAKNRSWKLMAKKYVSVAFRESDLPTQPAAKLPSLSVFFPMHNEAENVGRVIAQAQQVLPNVAKKFEIIVVNDGSTDDTAKIANKLAKKDRRIRVISQKNLGYGGALQTGFQAARYDWIFFSDGDLQFDLSDLAKFLPAAATHPVVLGYRQHRSDAYSRILLAKALKIWNKIFFRFPAKIKDVDCAFKLFDRSVVDHVFPLKSTGAMISTELILKLLDAKYDLAQVPVTHYPRLYGHQTGAKLNVVSGAVKETLTLWWTRIQEERQVPSLIARYFAILPLTLLFVLYRLIPTSGQ